jgi:hypothetical protein
VIKILCMMKRRPGMSMDEFIDYYEGEHCKFGEKHLSGIASKYIRRYLYPVAHLGSGEAAADAPYDAVMELWFESDAHLEAMTKTYSDPELLDAVLKDEERFLDRSKTRLYRIEERETKLPLS